VGNLVENAVKHNVPEGWFTVKTWTAGDRAMLKVASSGAPVPAEDLERLFERFYRADKSRSRKTGGFGLGLSIVKAVATAHGGSVQLAAVPGGGLDVTVALPLRSSAPPAPTASQAQTATQQPQQLQPRTSADPDTGS